MAVKKQTYITNVDRKRVVVFGCIMLLIMIIATGATGVLTSAIQQREEDRLVSTVGAIIGKSISRISFSGKHHLRLLIGEIRNQLPELAYISVETVDGIVLAHTDNAKNDSRLSDDELKRNRKILSSGGVVVTGSVSGEHTVKEILLPYMSGFSDEQAGIVRIGISMDDFKKSRQTNLIIQIVMILSLTISAIWLMSFISRYFSKRLAESEIALRKSEEFARTLMDIPTLAVFMIDRTGICLDSNETFLKRFGKSRDEVVGRSIWPLFPQEISESRQLVVSKVVNEKKSFRYEDERNGLWNDLYLEPIIGNDGEVEKVIVMGLDITDRRHAEEALRKSMDRFSRIASTIPGVIYDYVLFPDGTSKFLYLSSRFTEIFELNIEEVLADTNVVWKIIHPDDVLRLKHEDEKANREGSIFYSEVRIITPSGKEKWICFESRPNPSSPGEVAVWSGVILDITQRKQAEIELEREKLRTEAASVAAKIAFWEWDIRTDKMKWSNNIKHMLGLDDADIPVTYSEIIELVHPDERKDVLEKTERHIKLGESFNLECRIRTGDGEYVSWHAIGKSSRDSDGKVHNMTGAIVDITEIKAAEDEKRHLERQMLHVQKLESLGILAGGIAHDFNNILLAILGNAELAMLHLPEASAASTHLSEIQKAAERAADLSKQMLAYSGRGMFAIEVVDLNRLIIDMTHMIEISISKKALLKINTAVQVPHVEADATQIRQIVMNLAMNASEALEDSNGTISLSTGWQKCSDAFFKGHFFDCHSEEGIYAFLEVSDTGCGMDQETIARIFDPFFTTKFTGRGLGMAAVSGIVRGHKGSIQIRSEKGIGSTLTIYLPASDKMPENPVSSGESGHKLWSGKVMIVDDEESVRNVGRDMLSIIGFDVVTANDGMDAIDLFRKNGPFKIVILDLTMPNMDGEQTFLELAKIDPEVKVLFSSGYNEQQISDRIGALKPVGFIQKPYRLGALRDIISACISD